TEESDEETEESDEETEESDEKTEESDEKTEESANENPAMTPIEKTEEKLPEVEQSEVKAAEIKTVYLSDLEWNSAKVGYDKPQKDIGLDSKPLQLLDENGEVVTYEKGICAHAASEISYDISGKGYVRFKSYVGVNYGAGDGSKPGSCEFRVLADGVVLEETEVITGRDEQGYIEVEIPVDTKIFTLVSTDGGDGKTCDHSVWADAIFEQDESVLKKLSKVEAEAKDMIVPIDGTTVVSVTAFLGNGNKVDLEAEDITVEFSSSDEEVAEVDFDGTVTGLADGKATITCTVTQNTDATETEESAVVIKEATVDIIVGKGDETTWYAESVDGSQAVLFTQNADGGVIYTALKDGEVVVKNSYAGLKTSLGDFTTGLTYAGDEEVEINEVDDSYELFGAKTSYVENTYREMTLPFTKEGVEDVTFSIVVRLYNDGFAFRYLIDGEDEKELKISEEDTSFQIPEGCTSYVMKYTPWHEEAPHEKSNSQLTGDYAFPVLYQTKEDTWTLISEAALSGTYAGGMMKGRGDGLLDVEFVTKQNSGYGNENNGDVVTELPFESPWRYAVIGDLAAIHDNTMAENLSPDCKVEDTSFIKPGVTGWTWLNKDSVNDPDVYKQYIDMAAEMGWDYVLMDDGWQPSNWVETDGIRHRAFYDWTDDLIAYAESKGVGLLAWARNSDFDTPEELEALKIWADKGIKGIKIDFFNSQSQDTMKKLDNVMKATAEYKLMVNPHGVNKTSGERRTWPHALTREGILGAEQHRQGGKAELTAEYCCMLPFTRYAVGPADYTPLMSYQLVDKNAFTVSEMAAKSILYESGIQCLADKPAVYLNSPAKSLLKGLPASWDESRLVDADFGEYVNIARRSGDDWYLAMICNGKRDAEFALDFLKEGQEYYAIIYKDGATSEDIDVEMQVVTSESVLTIPMAAKGGASVKITQESPSVPDAITLNQEKVELEQFTSVQLNAVVTPEECDFDTVNWSSSDESVVTVKDGVITAVNPGIAWVTATAAFNEEVTAICEVNVVWPKYEMNSEVWTIHEENRENWQLNSESSLTIVSESGEYGNSVHDAKNVFFTDVEGDFTATVKVSFDPEDNYQSAGLIVYQDDKNVFELLRRYHSRNGGRIISGVNIDNGKFADDSNGEPRVADENAGIPVYLKVTKVGNRFHAFYSVDNETWIAVTDEDGILNNGITAEKLKVGIYCVNGSGRSGSIPATFEDFTLEQNGTFNQIDFAVELDQTLETLKVELEKLISYTEKFEAKDYTETSYQALQDAVAKAEEALEDGTNKVLMKECIDEIKSAIAGLASSIPWYPILPPTDIEEPEDPSIPWYPILPPTDIEEPEDPSIPWYPILPSDPGDNNSENTGNGGNSGSSSSGSSSSGSGSSGGSSSSSSSSSNASSEATPGTWIQDELGWQFKWENRVAAMNQWVRSSSGGRLNWYYIGANGYMSEGWQELNGHKYYFHAVSDGTRGHMYTGWHQIEGKWYYFTETSGALEGSLVVNTTTPDGYSVDANGVWVP
ncbi:MAG: glycoside hydrolase family 97 catalytic domain-containing protein, partial [Lachnospiraceae bacterium]